MGKLTGIFRLGCGIVGTALLVCACARLPQSVVNDQPAIAITYYPTPTSAAVVEVAPATAAPSPTPVAEPIAQAQPTPTQAPVPTLAPIVPAEQLAILPPTALISGLRHEQQTWNNCGPATIAMLLSAYGRAETQRDAAIVLKPNPDDKNVSPDELANYARSLGYSARVVVGGDLDLLRALVSNGLPVIAESWFIPEPNDEMGHYQLLIGYEGDEFIFYDSYQGPDVREDIATFDGLWKVFNRTAVVVWSAEQEALAQTILGSKLDDRAMYESGLTQAQADITQNPRDKYAWFNAGTNLLALGRGSEAAEAFDTAQALKLPWRMMWYQFGPYAAWFEQGRYDDVVKLANTTLRPVKNLEESLYWRARARAAQGNIEAARTDLQQALVFNPNYAEARAVLEQLGAAG